MELRRAAEGADREGARRRAPQLSALSRPARPRGRAGARLVGHRRRMLKLAQALQAAGASVYAVSLRGHGGSGTGNGDVSYIGQLDDDLADLVKGARPRQARHASHAARASLPAAAWCCASPAVRRPACSTTISRSRPTSRRTRPPTSPTRRMGRRRAAAHRGAVAARRLRPAMVPGTAGRALRHGRQGRQQPHAGLLLPAGGQPAARPRLARPSGPHRRADPHRGRRRRRAVQCRPVPADGAGDQSPHRRDGGAQRGPSRHDRRSPATTAIAAVWRKFRAADRRLSPA